MSPHPLEQAVSFLLSRQDEDGLWRDYQLEPGRSTSWVSAYVGYALVQAIGRDRSLSLTVDALRSSKRTGGWGYNSHVACDADSTSWVIRFLAAMDELDNIDAAELLDPYVTPTSGRVRTFYSAERFGSWGWEHDEVAPIAGMALMAAGEHALATRIRHGVLNAPSWKSFWWRCASYVGAQNLAFLNLSGGIPDQIRNREVKCIDDWPTASSTIDLAQRISAALSLGLPAKDIDRLTEAQENDGGWPTSKEMLVPRQRNGSGGEAVADDRRLMSTAAAVLSLCGRSAE